jgi:hypothetical protein
MPYLSTAQVCSPKCGLTFHKRQEQRKQDLQRKAFNRETRKRKAALMTRSDWVKKAQTAFNAYIRTRDADKPCISCGATNADRPDRHGGAWDCGHYLTTGAHPELRFNEFNAHRQCKECNNHRSGNVGKYRVNLIERIGIDLVEWLEGPHNAGKTTVEELQFLESHYKQQTKRLQADK